MPVSSKNRALLIWPQSRGRSAGGTAAPSGEDSPSFPSQAPWGWVSGHPSSSVLSLELCPVFPNTEHEFLRKRFPSRQFRVRKPAEEPQASSRSSLCDVTGAPLLNGTPRAIVCWIYPFSEACAHQCARPSGRDWADGGSLHTQPNSLSDSPPASPKNPHTSTASYPAIRRSRGPGPTLLSTFGTARAERCTDQRGRTSSGLFKAGRFCMYTLQNSCPAKAGPTHRSSAAETACVQPRPAV